MHSWRRVLVCGTNYGSTYLRALALGRNMGRLMLAGVMSRGSARSQQYAQQYGVPHWREVQEIPQGAIDLACVAVAGEAGLAISKALLARGIAVICEHPLSATMVDEALNVARRHRTHFHVNGHFADLPAAQAFLQAVAQTRARAPCWHFTLEANLRTLYSALDLLGRAHGSLNQARVQAQHSPEAHWFRQLDLCLNNEAKHAVHGSLVCQSFSGAEDDGSANLMNHRMSAVFEHGSVLLAESQGPVLWLPTPLAMVQGGQPSFSMIDARAVTGEQLMQQRDWANFEALSRLDQCCQGHAAPFYQQAEYLLHLARLWDECMQTIHAPYQSQGAA